MTDLESRIRRLEDRVLIGEQVIKYAVGVDRRDWEMFAECFTDPVHVDFSASAYPRRTSPGMTWSPWFAFRSAASRPSSISA